MLFDGITLVISPLISLMKDQLDFLRVKNIPATKIDSTMSAKEIQHALQRAISGEIKLLFLAPERLSGEQTLRQLEKVREVSVFAVDEAHCLSEWGHSYRSGLRLVCQAGVVLDCHGNAESE